MRSKNLERIAGCLGWVLLLATWLFVTARFSSLPGIIPVHFNLKGEADRFGPRASVWFLPALGSGIFLLLTAIGRHAHRLPRKPGEPPASAQELSVLRLFFSLPRLSVLLVFALDLWHLFSGSSGAMARATPWLLPLNGLLLFAPIAWFLWTVLRRKGAAGST